MRRKVSYASLQEAIRAGRGVGLRDAYRPWIPVTKTNTSSVSMQSRAQMPGLTRRCHFLSQAEHSLAHVLYWLGVKDIREQFPMWPWPHRQPLSSVLQVNGIHEGMSAIAADAGIRLRTYSGLPVPHILSTDLLVTLDAAQRSGPLLAVSCKPRAKLAGASPSDWVLERLELERRYWKHADVRWTLVDPEDLPKRLVRQLIWLAPLDANPELNALLSDSSYARFVELLRGRVDRMPATNAISEAGLGFGWSDATTHYLARTAMWRSEIDVNPFEPINMLARLPLGGARVKHVLRTNLFSTLEAREMKKAAEIRAGAST